MERAESGQKGIKTVALKESVDNGLSFKVKVVERGNGCNPVCSRSGRMLGYSGMCIAHIVTRAWSCWHTYERTVNMGTSSIIRCGWYNILSLK